MKNMEPLASKLRPKNLNEVLGQKHLIGEGKILSSMVKSGSLMNMIFYGPGSLTLASILIVSEALIRLIFLSNFTILYCVLYRTAL